jgi:hypothetical protein
MRRSEPSRVAIAALAAALLALAAGPAPGPKEWLDRYLAVRDGGDLPAQKALIAPGARIWFGEKKGEGELIDLDGPGSQWDRELHASLEYANPKVSRDTVTAEFVERNDFYRLAGIDGWKAKITFRFDSQGRIVEEVYVPEPGQPRTRELLAPFLEWARANRPGMEERLYPGGKLTRNLETARQWRAALTDWRESTGVPGP